MPFFGSKKPKEDERYLEAAAVLQSLKEGTAAGQVTEAALTQLKSADVVVPRGSRFEGDSDSVFFYIQRSKNANVVCYGTHPQDVVEGYWLDLEPSYQEKARAKGKMHDREELNIVERKMAYGVSSSTNDGALHVIEFVALPKVKMYYADLTLFGKQNAAVTIISGEWALVVSAFVQATEPKSMLQLPSVEYVELRGVSLSSGLVVSERFTG